MNKKQKWLSMSEEQLEKLEMAENIEMATGQEFENITHLTIQQLQDLDERLRKYHFLNKRVRRSLPLSTLYFTSQVILEEWLLADEIKSFDVKDIAGFIDYLKNNEDELSAQRVEAFRFLENMMNFLDIDFITV